MNSVLVQAKQARFLGLDISAVPPFLTFEELEHQFPDLFAKQMAVFESRQQQCFGQCYHCKQEKPIVQCMPCHHMVCFACFKQRKSFCCQPILYLQEPTQVIQLQTQQPSLPRITPSKTVPDLMKLQVRQQVSSKTLLKLLREHDFTIQCTGYTIIEAQPHDFVIYDFVLAISDYTLKFFKRYSDFRRLVRLDRYLEKLPQGKWWFFGGNQAEYIADRKLRLQSWLFRQLKGSNNQSIELARFICGK